MSMDFQDAPDIQMSEKERKKIRKWVLKVLKKRRKKTDEIID